MPRCPSCAAAMSRSTTPRTGRTRCSFASRLSAFETGDRRLACVQARLTIDNTADSWLTRLFTAEYAGLFDVFLPGLAAFRMPLPLGGTSNHFHTATLRSLGGWDPYNVTEDADLGIRLARAGFRTTVIQSTTYEEAPAHLVAWTRQRTRWFKGYLQTWAVHMRHPLQAVARSRARRLSGVPARGRRRGAGGAGAWRVSRRARRPARVRAVLVGQDRHLRS